MRVFTERLLKVVKEGTALRNPQQAHHILTTEGYAGTAPHCGSSSSARVFLPTLSRHHNMQAACAAHYVMSRSGPEAVTITSAKLLKRDMQYRMGFLNISCSL